MPSLHSLEKKFVKKFAVLVAVFVGVINFAFAADIVFSPSTGAYTVGSSFSVDVLVSNNQDTINAVSGQFTFSSDTLTLTGISKAKSIIGMWAEEPSSSSSGGSFEGIILNPGFSGSSGKIVTLSFVAKKAGMGALTFTSGSVLANDGNATNVVKNLGRASYTLTVRNEVESKPVLSVVPSVTTTPTTPIPVITSDVYPDEEKWYNTREAAFSWKIPSSVTAVRTLYSEKPDSTPTKVYTPPVAGKTFTLDEDGSMYMHVQFKTDSEWGPVAHRKFQVDTVTPKDVSVVLVDGEVTSNTTPTITVQATDELSGLEYITIQIDNAETVEYPVVASNSYKLTKLQGGKHLITVSVYDRAGNVSKASTSVTIEKLDTPIITEYTKRTEVGNKITVVGRAQAGKTLEVILIDEEGKSEIETTKVDPDGNFTVVWSRKVGAGVYEMSARLVDTNGVTSDPTESRAVIVENVQLIRVGMFIMNWLSLILIIILASTLVIATFWYSFLQFTRFRSKIHRTMRETEATLKENVQALREYTEQFHTLLVKAQKKRELTKEEATILKKFKKRLDTMEKEVEQKIENIK